MIDYRITFRQEDTQHLEEMYDHIAGTGSPENAERYVDAIITYCEGLATFPHRGTARDHIRPGLRTIG